MDEADEEVGQNRATLPGSFSSLQPYQESRTCWKTRTSIQYVGTSTFDHLWSATLHGCRSKLVNGTGCTKRFSMTSSCFWRPLKSDKKDACRHLMLLGNSNRYYSIGCNFRRKLYSNVINPNIHHLTHGASKEEKDLDPDSRRLPQASNILKLIKRIERQ